MDRSIGFQSMSADYTSIELIGKDRPGLLSELTAVLAHLKCNVVNAEIWTHNTWAAAVMHITDQETGLAIDDPEKLARIKAFLCNVLRGRSQSRKARTVVSLRGTHRERRLHQIMFADRDYERVEEDEELDAVQRPNVSVDNWYDKDYSVVMVRCNDRPKLLFDTVCTLTDMQYVVFHGSVDAEGPEAIQEYYVRHIDGSSFRACFGMIMRRGANIYAEFLGGSFTSDAYHITEPHPDGNSCNSSRNLALIFLDYFGLVKT